MSSTARKWFGQRDASVIGADKWMAQDSIKTWSDGGEVVRVVERISKVLIAELERIVSDNATAGVSDYLSAAKIGVRADQAGEVVVGLIVSNDQADMVVEIPLRKTIIAALTDMRPRLGVDPQSQALLSALIGLGQSLVSLGHPFSKSQDQKKEAMPSAMMGGVIGQAARPMQQPFSGRLSPARSSHQDDASLLKQRIGLTQ